MGRGSKAFLLRHESTECLGVWDIGSHLLGGGSLLQTPTKKGAPLLAAYASAGTSLDPTGWGGGGCGGEGGRRWWRLIACRLPTHNKQGANQ